MKVLLIVAALWGLSGCAVQANPEPGHVGQQAQNESAPAKPSFHQLMMY
ncbi:hypothetical protein [Ferrimonas balearica]|nr:hypothetical protein [Ferrimonas balearica]MBY5991465.1 hypothetical protein [Ferrimonas balearica]